MQNQEMFFDQEKNVTSQMHYMKNAFETLRISIIAEEYDLQRIIADKLKQHNIPFIKEYRLDPRNRIDFFSNGIGIEIKKGKPNREKVHQQLYRYTAFEEIQGIVLVIERNVVGIPLEINQKPCLVIGLNRLWGIAI